MTTCPTAPLINRELAERSPRPPRSRVFENPSTSAINPILDRGSDPSQSLGRLPTAHPLPKPTRFASTHVDQRREGSEPLFAFSFTALARKIACRLRLLPTPYRRFESLPLRNCFVNVLATSNRPAQRAAHGLPKVEQADAFRERGGMS